MFRKPNREISFYLDSVDEILNLDSFKRHLADGFNQQYATAKPDYVAIEDNRQLEIWAGGFANLMRYTNGSVVLYYLA